MDWRFLLSLALFLPCLTADGIFDKVITTANGPVQGIVHQTRNPNVEYVSFMGLRFADPPARFEPAKPLTEKWSTPKVAREMGSVCTQPDLQGSSTGSEDCLYLNIHVPRSALEDPTKQLPVMFFVHGGSFTFGDGGNYGGKLLTENDDTILVTVNYRLGVMGFISMESDTAFTANNGLRDVVLAMQWTRQNIAAFHGNPDKVTIFGESAGAPAIHYLLMSPLAEGLFHRAIIQSGTFGFWSYQPNPGKVARKLAKAADCPNTEDAHEIRKCFEKIDASKLMDLQQKFAPRFPPTHPGCNFMPSANEPQTNPFFADDPASFFTFHGKSTVYASKVPVMIGITKDEGSNMFASFVSSIPDQLKRLNENWNELAPQVLFFDNFVPEKKWAQVAEATRRYYYGDQPLTQDNLEPLVDFYSDSLTFLPTRNTVRELAENGVPVYWYRYSYLGPNCPMAAAGGPCMPGKVGHADDLPHLFDHPAYGHDFVPGTKDDTFSKNLVRLWTRFADTGAPEINQWENGDSLNWEPSRTLEDGEVAFDILDLNASLGKANLDYLAERARFWRETLSQAWQDSTSEENKQTSSASPIRRVNCLSIVLVGLLLSINVVF